MKQSIKVVVILIEMFSILRANDRQPKKLYQKSHIENSESVDRLTKDQQKKQNRKATKKDFLRKKNQGKQKKYIKNLPPEKQKKIKRKRLKRHLKKYYTRDEKGKLVLKGKYKRLKNGRIVSVEGKRDSVNTLRSLDSFLMKETEMKYLKQINEEGGEGVRFDPAKSPGALMSPLTQAPSAGQKRFTNGLIKSASSVSSDLSDAFLEESFADHVSVD